MRKRISLALLAGLMILSAAGCAPAAVTVEPAANPTLLSIMVMLTQTAAAPTVTITPTGTVQPPTATNQPEQVFDGILNQTITAENTALTVLSANMLNEIEKNKPLEGKAYLDVEVYIKNLAGDPPYQAYSPYYFNLVDPGGTTYMPVGFAQLPRLLGGELHPGEIARGHVAFEVPAGSSGYMLRYNLPFKTGSIPVILRTDLNQNAGSMPAGLEPVDSTPWFTSGMPTRDKRAEGEGFWVKIDDVKTASQVRTETAPDGWKFLILHGMIGNTSQEGKLTYNSQYFKIKDELGYEYAPLILTGDEYLGVGSIPGDMSDEGNLVFLIPSRVKQVGVMYNPQNISGKSQEVRIAIYIKN